MRMEVRVSTQWRQYTFPVRDPEKGSVVIELRGEGVVWGEAVQYEKRQSETVVSAGWAANDRPAWSLSAQWRTRRRG